MAAQPVAYQHFAAFYDRVMDDPGPRADRVVAAIRRHRPVADGAPLHLLELGCGTGALLTRLPGTWSATGLDRSPAMLAEAQHQAPGAELVEGDMSDFELDTRFDVIACVFDSLNHLLSEHRWAATFDRVLAHLGPDGIFVFDVNTTGELERLHEDPPFVHEFDEGTAIIDVSAAQEADGSMLSHWDIRIFVHTSGHDYRLVRETISEFAVPWPTLAPLIERRFDLLEATDESGGPPSDDAVKIHVVARRPGRS